MKQEKKGVLSNKRQVRADLLSSKVNQLSSNNTVTDQLRARNFHFVYKTYPGAYEWKVWRNSLIDFAPMLFR